MVASQYGCEPRSQQVPVVVSRPNLDAPVAHTFRDYVAEEILNRYFQSLSSTLRLRTSRELFDGFLFKDGSFRRCRRSHHGQINRNEASDVVRRGGLLDQMNEVWRECSNA